MSDFDLSTIGKRLRAIRESLKLTQAELAKKVGLTQSAISHFEEGKRTPSAQALEKIANGLGMSVDTLLGLASNSSGDSEKDAAIEGIVNKLKSQPKEKIYALNRFIGEMMENP
jgi:transcriptional regulator with XRE-family HTH domain